ncbi:hypothetical protein DSO57_1018702 [Entomophthora muscae]|uniref:Uncharacterized protein n=1 Tax=Entomophthora muscae TaxID=34485 RepID=A0ACC2UDR5_9FUNG|nr:hypothetical protein DSO57_1018702 [Entomophthora muscae]
MPSPPKWTNSWQSMPLLTGSDPATPLTLITGHQNVETCPTSNNHPRPQSTSTAHIQPPGARLDPSSNLTLFGSLNADAIKCKEGSQIKALEGGVPVLGIAGPCPEMGSHLPSMVRAL